MSKEQEQEKAELSADAVWNMQERMLEKELMKMNGFAPLVKTLIEFGIRGMKALQFITTYTAYADEAQKKK